LVIGNSLKVRERGFRLGHAELDPRIPHFREMDCRVKPGNDQRNARRLGFSVASGTSPCRHPVPPVIISDDPAGLLAGPPHRFMPYALLSILP
jgi:hypothetical protein